MNDRLGLLIFWLIPIVLLIFIVLAIMHIGRKQKRDLELWKQSNELLSDRIQQSTKRMEEIEAKLKDIK